MPFTTLSGGLTLTIPTNGTRNWGTTVLNTTWTAISAHGHTGSGDGNQMVTGSYSNNSVTTIKLSKNIGVTQYATTLAPSGTTQTVDWNNGNVQILDVGSATGDVTLTLSNPAAGHTYKLLFIQGATPRDLVWPAAVLWPQGQVPIHSQGDDEVDVLELYYDGTNYLGSWELDFS